MTATKLAFCCGTLAFISLATAQESVERKSEVTTAPDSIPDVREEKLAVKLQDRNWFVVPIPISNPTTDTGPPLKLISGVR